MGPSATRDGGAGEQRTGARWLTEPLVFAATSDLAGKLRGKAFPLSALDSRLVKGVGWTPTNAPHGRLVETFINAPVADALANAGRSLQGESFPAGLVGVLQGLLLFCAVSGEFLTRYRVRLADRPAAKTTEAKTA